MLGDVVPDEINKRVTEFIREHPYKSKDGGGFEDDNLLKEDWFVENVILNPQAAGAVRSLLGKNATLPTWMYNHQSTTPKPVQGWHRDGCSRHGYEMNLLQVFYYPQDTPLELGPTEVLPGSHFLFNLARYMGHYGSISWSEHTVAPASTIFITVYSIWHRRAASSAHGVRNMLKYLYWRMAPPQRDWIIKPDFNLDDLNDLENAAYSEVRPAQDQFRNWHDVAEMFFWLCGRMEDFPAFLGTERWPMGHPPAENLRIFTPFQGSCEAPVATFGSSGVPPADPRRLATGRDHGTFGSGATRPQAGLPARPTTRWRP